MECSIAAVLIKLRRYVSDKLHRIKFFIYKLLYFKWNALFWFIRHDERKFYRFFRNKIFCKVLQKANLINEKLTLTYSVGIAFPRTLQKINQSINKAILTEKKCFSVKIIPRRSNRRPEAAGRGKLEKHSKQ